MDKPANIIIGRSHGMCIPQVTHTYTVSSEVEVVCSGGSLVFLLIKVLTTCLVPMECFLRCESVMVLSGGFWSLSNILGIQAVGGRTE